MTTRRYQCQQEITAQEALEQEQHQLAQRFGLVQSRRQLEQQLADVQTRLDTQTTRIDQASSRNSMRLRRDQHKLEREWQQLEQQRTHLDHNFVVGKIDQPSEAFDDIDSAASNGTVLMAKLVTGLAMLHLMQHKRHTLRAVCYLDEALSLDTGNQTSLIETACEFGFALIFASPAPLTTARYCVPIQHHQGHNHISRQSWQILEVINDKDR